MKISVLVRNEVSIEKIELLSRLVSLIPWPANRQAMGDITLSLLDGKSRVAEEVFGWNRNTVELGINEFRTGITCLNDFSKRRRPKVEEGERNYWPGFVESSIPGARQIRNYVRPLLMRI